MSELRTRAGDEVWLYPKSPNDMIIKGCIIKRGPYPWHTDEKRYLAEWNLDGKYRHGLYNLKNHSNDLVMELNNV